MVQSKSAQKMPRPDTPRGGPCRLKCPSRPFSADLAGRPKQSDLWRLTVKSEDEEEDVIDLGAPRKLRDARGLGGPAPRSPRPYTPNPRLYPGPQKPQKRQAQIKQKLKTGGRRNRKKSVHRRPVPNPRLYRPAPPKPPPPPAKPRTVWRPPVQGKLETASRAALRLSGLWRTPDPSADAISIAATSVKTGPLTQNRSPICKKQSQSQSGKLVIKLPAAAGDGNPSEQLQRYRPASRHFRDRELRSRDSTPTGGRVIQLSTRGNMDATPRHSTSPEDCSEGNDPQSAPSEFLAEVSVLPDSTPTGGREIQLSTRGNRDATPRHSTSPEDCSEGNDPQSAPSEFLAEVSVIPDSTPTGGRVIQLSTRGNMDATPRHSTSPEDCSEGNDPQSAPSEFLAEFLSAIMRRQYAEALKYCRLILQYEPRNATARGFYPLLQQKLAQQSPTETSDKPAPPRHRHQRSRASRSPDLGGASSGANSGTSSPVPQDPAPHVVMEQEADSSCSARSSPGLRSGSSQSSLELDSSPARSSPSLSLSRRTDSASASGTWDSSGSGARDDNGNPAPAHTSSPNSYACDAENNPPLVSTAGREPRRAARAGPLTLQSEQSSESLRRLRAQFTCSIK